MLVPFDLSHGAGKCRVGRMGASVRSDAAQVDEDGFSNGVHPGKRNKRGPDNSPMPPYSHLLNAPAQGPTLLGRTH